MGDDEVLKAVQTLLRLDRRDEAVQVAGHLPESVSVTDLLRAADGAQQLARALAEIRRGSSADAQGYAEADLSGLSSLYS